MVVVLFAGIWLDEDAKARLAGFENFVKGVLEAAAVKAETIVQGIEKAVPILPSVEDISNWLDLTGVETEEMRKKVAEFFTVLEARAANFVAAIEKAQLHALPEQEIVADLKQLAAALDGQAVALDQDAVADQRAALKKQQLEMLGRKWLSQHKSSMEAETKRLALIKRLGEAQRLANTKWLSMHSPN